MAFLQKVLLLIVGCSTVQSIVSVSVSRVPAGTVFFLLFFSSLPLGLPCPYAFIFACASAYLVNLSRDSASVTAVREITALGAFVFFF